MRWAAPKKERKGLAPAGRANASIRFWARFQTCAGRCSKRQVRVLLEAPLVFIEQPHGFRRLEFVGLDGSVHLRLHLPLQLVFVILHRRKRLDDGVAFDDFLDVVAGRLVRVEEHVHLIDSAKEVVQIAHDVLVGAHQKETEVIRFELAVPVHAELVQRESVEHVAQVDELVDLAVGIAGDVHQGRLARRAFVEAADRHDRKQLAERPVVEQRLEHGKVAEVLVAEAVFELADFFGNVGLAAETFDDFLADFPVEMFDLRFVRQFQQAEREHIVRVLAAFERIVVGLELVQLANVLLDVEQFLDQRVFVFAAGEFYVLPDFANGAEHFDDQHAVVRHEGAAAFADDVRVGHFLRVANVADVINDVIGVFLQGVIGRAVERGPAAVVIDTEAAADVDVFDGETHFVKLAVETGGLLDGLFDGENVRHLRTDVKMDQLEAVREVFRFEQFDRGEQFNCAQTELGVFAGALRPFPGPFAEQPGPDADERFDSEWPRHADDLLQLLQLLNDHDDFLAQLDPHQRHADEDGVFVTVADDEAVRIGLEREAREQFRLAADFQTEPVGFAGVENFFNDFAQLIDLDGKHAAVFALVVEFGDGTAERFVD